MSLDFLVVALYANWLTTDTFRHPQTFFSFRVIEEWDGLPETVVNIYTVDTFKKKLDCHFRNRGYK